MTHGRPDRVARDGHVDIDGLMLATCPSRVPEGMLVLEPAGPERATPP